MKNKISDQHLTEGEAKELLATAINSKAQVELGNVIDCICTLTSQVRKSNFYKHASKVIDDKVLLENVISSFVLSMISTLMYNFDAR